MKNNNVIFEYFINKNLNFKNIYKFDENKNLENINYSNYYEYIDYNYTLKQLKSLGKKYGLHTSKHKHILKKIYLIF